VKTVWRPDLTFFIGNAGALTQGGSVEKFTQMQKVVPLSEGNDFGSSALVA
jgi:hypothetical protein